MPFGLGPAVLRPGKARTSAKLIGVRSRKAAPLPCGWLIAERERGSRVANGAERGDCVRRPRNAHVQRTLSDRRAALGTGGSGYRVTRTTAITAGRAFMSPA